MPHVSVIMAAFNAEPYITAAIQSILNQTFDDFELLIVDDGSTDAAPALAASVGDSRVRLLRQSHAGQAAARQHAFQQASGELVTLQDADDLSHSERLEHQVHALRESASADVVYVQSWQIDTSGRVLGMHRSDFPGRRHPVLELAEGARPVDQTAMYRRALLERIGGWDTSLRGGTELNLAVRAALAGARFIELPHLLYEYRLNPMGVCRTRGTEVMTAIVRSRLRAIQAVADDPERFGLAAAEVPAWLARVLERLVPELSAAIDPGLCRESAAVLATSCSRRAAAETRSRLARLRWRLTLRRDWPRLTRWWQTAKAWTHWQASYGILGAWKPSSTGSAI